ncbi:MAG: TolC family protein [Spirochaetes bacterium]|nr:TolC family protein [Spirochaetota bacterium]
MSLKKHCTQPKAEAVIRYTDGLIFPICLALLMLLCAGLQAQESKPAVMRLNLEESVDLAIKNNLSLETSRTNVATKKRASGTSWNQFIPSVQVGGSLVRDNQKSTVSGMIPVDLSNFFSTLPQGTLYAVRPYSAESPQWHIAGTIQASLNLNLAMFENMKRLRIDYQGGLLSYEKAKAQLERDIRKAYHNILLIQENIAVLKGNITNAERQVQMAQANFNAGLVPELTLLQARVARENMRPAIDQAENGLKLSMAQFAMNLGLDYDTVFELAPVTGNINFIPLDVAEMISKAASGKPDIQELRHSMLMLESARKAQIYSLTPSLTLSWNHTSAFTKDPWKDSWFGGKDNWRKSGSFTLSLGVRLHSLIPFSTDFQAVKNTEDQIKTATIGLAQMVYGTEIEIYNIILSLEKARISAEALAQTVNLAEQSYSLTERAYQAGLQDYFQVQSAQQSLHQARVQMLEQQFSYLNSLIDLEYSTGVPFGTLSRRSN